MYRHEFVMVMTTTIKKVKAWNLEERTTLPSRDGSFKALLPLMPAEADADPHALGFRLQPEPRCSLLYIDS